MNVSRRTFVAGAATAALARPLSLSSTTAQVPDPTERFDPWLEIDPAALRYNVSVVARLSGGRPIMAVIKNNAYGLGLATVAAVLEELPEIMGFAVVKTDAAITLRDAGIRKPVLLMGLFSDADGPELVARNIDLILGTDDSGERVARAARQAGHSARVHVYLDTGMSRMGIPYHRAIPWLDEVAPLGLDIQSTFMGFTEEPEFDREQLRRFIEVTGAAKERGFQLGALHAASSNGVYHLPEAHLDLVRPGIAIFGAYPSDEESERAIAELHPAVRLRARVVRVERLRMGDSVSYGREYTAERATWIATLPVGHTDGYPRKAVNGARVLINGALYPAIGAVSASHTIVELGDEPTVSIGDVATLLGPDDPAIRPNALAAATDRSVYDILMHLNPVLPKVLV